MAYENNDKKMESVYSKRIKAGKRRTYFFDVRETRGNDFYLTITESRKRFDSEGYDRHKIFLYKEDFNKFVKGLSDAVDFVKTDLMPDFDFDAFNHDNSDGEDGQFSPREDGQIIRTESGHATPANENGDSNSEIKILPSGDEKDVTATKEREEQSPVLPADNGSTEEVDKW